MTWYILFTCSIASELFINWAILREIVYNSEDIDPSKRDESFLFKIPDLDLRKGEKNEEVREAGKVNMEDVTLEKNQEISPLKGHHVGPGGLYFAHSKEYHVSPGIEAE